MPLGREDLRDTLGQLKGWVRDPRELRRILRLDESEHAALTERIKVVADALQLHPDIRRANGQTQITLHAAEGDGLTADEVRLAARIEDIYQSVRSQA
jgi:4a-hydroxytetrahydrobiopterin dehydratase